MSSIELISNLHSSNISFSLAFSACENACYSAPSMQPRLADDGGQMLVSTSEGSRIKFIFVLCFYKHTGFLSLPVPCHAAPAPPPFKEKCCFNFGLFSSLSPTPTPTLQDLGGISRAVWHSLEPRKLVFTASSLGQNTELLVIVSRSQQCLSV